ncbi:DUF6456 domain-containing protein [Bauldia sp.]|uniref:DUF6456 domain-containing protein n=1 Tax=Bauldia sp. TaxID=2575872 RepID=UPI003BAAD03D
MADNNAITRALKAAIKGAGAHDRNGSGEDGVGVPHLIARGLLRREGDSVVLTPAGLSHLRREALRGYDAPSQDVEATVIEEPNVGRRKVMRNAGESPLARLRRSRGRGGKPLINDAEFAAGERFRSDFTRGQLMPSVTTNWSAFGGGGRGGKGQGIADLADATIAARRRVEAALNAVGPDYAGLLVDFCGFLKGIDRIERERSWPARSAKLVIRLALASLARHYGFAEAGRGPLQGGQVHWGTADYRPSIR